MTHKHRRHFHLLFSSASFSKDLKIVSLELPQIFEILLSCCQRYCFADFLLDHLSLMYKRATNLCELVLYPGTFLNMFTRRRTFLVEFVTRVTYVCYHKSPKSFFSFEFCQFSDCSKTSSTTLQA